MTARATLAMVFDPEALELAFASDPAGTLVELAGYLRRRKMTLRLRNLQGVGSTDTAMEHFHLSIDLGVQVVDPDAAVPALTDAEQTYVEYVELPHGDAL